MLKNSVASLLMLGFLGFAGVAQADLRVVGGSLVMGGGHLTVEDTFDVRSGGTLKGRGTIHGDVTIASGGTLKVSVNGTEHDRINVEGQLDISAGSLDLDMQTPSRGAYILAAYTSLSGTAFSQVSDLPSSFLIDYAYRETGSSNRIALVHQTFNNYRNWATDAGLDEDSEIDLDDNPDGDLLSNFAEWGFGLDPNAYDSNGMILDGLHLMSRGSPTAYLASISNGVDRRAVFSRRTDYGTQGLRYRVQFSGDMINWHESVDTPIMVDSDDEIEVVTVDFPLFLPDRSKAQFFRVIIESEDWE